MSALKFQQIGLLGRMENARAVASIKSLKQFLLHRQLDVVLSEEVDNVLPEHGLSVYSRQELGHACDLVIVVGGDGSMLSAARDLAEQQVPVLGVNRGRLGFLTDVLPDELETKISAVLEGEYVLEERFLLNAFLIRGGMQIAKASAFNDVVVSSGEVARMIDLETYIDDQFVNRQRSDGLIVSTPTGSTAYNLSAGGPIMHPGLDALALVPMFPHGLSHRPIVVAGSSQIKILVDRSSRARQPMVTCDGQDVLDAQGGDTILIEKKTHKLKLVHPLDHNFYTTCREKLGWGNQLGEQ